MYIFAKFYSFITRYWKTDLFNDHFVQTALNQNIHTRPNPGVSIEENTAIDGLHDRCKFTVESIRIRILH